LQHCYNHLQVADEVADTSCACQTCGKHFSTANAYDNHLKSKKHRETAARQDKYPMSDVPVQQVNAKNDGRVKDAAYSGTSGAVGRVTKHLQQDTDIGTVCCQLSVMYLAYYVVS